MKRRGNLQCVEVLLLSLTVTSLFSMEAYLLSTSTRSATTCQPNKRDTLFIFRAVHVCMKFILLTRKGSPKHTFPVPVFAVRDRKNEDMRREGGEESLLLSVLHESNGRRFLAEALAA